MFEQIRAKKKKKKKGKRKKNCNEAREKRVIENVEINRLII